MSEADKLVKLADRHQVEGEPPKDGAAEDKEGSLVPQVALALEQAAHRIDVALDPVFARKEQIKEATRRLHPLLREALTHPLAASVLDTSPVSDEFMKQSELLACIDELNVMVGAFMQSVEGSERLRPREAKRLMEYLTIHASLLSAGGMLKRISTAFSVLAKTKLREIAKRPSREPYDETEFEREQIIHRYIADFLGGINTQRG